MQGEVKWFYGSKTYPTMMGQDLRSCNRFDLPDTEKNRNGLLSLTIQGPDHRKNLVRCDYWYHR